MAKRFITLIILILTVTACSKGDIGKSLSDGAPEFTLPAVDGSFVTMSDYQGKVVLVDFWATWCPPCNDMIPILSKLHKKYSDRGLVILGVSLDQDGLGALGTFVHENMIPYKVIMGDSRISRSFGGVSSIPTLYMVDRDGRLVRKLTGFHSYAELEKQVKMYL